MKTKGNTDPDEQSEEELEGGGESENQDAGGKGQEQEFEITLGMGEDGQPITKKVSLDEIKKGYMRQEDYTRKTQTLADERKRLLAGYDEEEDDEEDLDEDTQGQPSQQSQLSPEARGALRQEMLSILGSPEGRRFVEQVAEEKVSTREGLSKLESEFTRLEKELDGSDGRPKFDREEILAYGKQKNNYDPFSVYWDLHRPQLIEWETQQALKKQGKVVKTERSTAFTPPPPKGKLSTDSKKAALEYFKQVEASSSE